MKYDTKEFLLDIRNHGERKYELVLLENGEKVRLIGENYNIYFEDLLKRLPEDFEYARTFMHDSRILSHGFEGNDYIIRVYQRGIHTTITKVTFVGAYIIQASDGMYWWIDDEVYLTESGRYEVYLMTENRDCEECTEMIVVADDIRVER